MSRVLLVALEEGQVIAACAAEKVGVSSIEPLSRGGVRLVCKSIGGAARMARKFEPQLIDGVVIRERRRPATPLW